MGIFATPANIFDAAQDCFGFAGERCDPKRTAYQMYRMYVVLYFLWSENIAITLFELGKITFQKAHHIKVEMCSVPLRFFIVFRYFNNSVKSNTFVPVKFQFVQTNTTVNMQLIAMREEKINNNNEVECVLNTA